MLAYIRERIAHPSSPARRPLGIDGGGTTRRRSDPLESVALTDSTARLSDELKKRHPEIQWEQVRGFRNVATHAYDRIQLKQVANIVANDLPLMRQAIDMELALETAILSPTDDGPPGDGVAVLYSNAHVKQWYSVALNGTQRIQSTISEPAAANC